MFSGLPPGDHDESKIRKAYFKMAQNYHPDKNPNGRDMFEKVNNLNKQKCFHLKPVKYNRSPGATYWFINSHYHFLKCNYLLLSLIIRESWFLVTFTINVRTILSNMLLKFILG